jgi:hypothetical protein
MANDKMMFSCDVCGNPYQHGRHLYEGKPLLLYGSAFACPTCWESNHDGWSPNLEPVLLRLLEKQGLPVPKRLANGLLPRNL